MHHYIQRYLSKIVFDPKVVYIRILHFEEISFPVSCRQCSHEIVKIFTFVLVGIHRGVERTKAILHGNYFWVGMNRDLKEYLEKCCLTRVFPEDKKQKSQEDKLAKFAEYFMMDMNPANVSFSPGFKISDTYTNCLFCFLPYHHSSPLIFFDTLILLGEVFNNDHYVIFCVLS